MEMGFIFYIRSTQTPSLTCYGENHYGDHRIIIYEQMGLVFYFFFLPNKSSQKNQTDPLRYYLWKMYA